MRHQGVTFDNLADYLEGRLQGETRQRVEAHLAQGCPRCERDLAWLRRFAQAARHERARPTPQPPATLVAQVHASFRARRASALSSHWSRPSFLPLAGSWRSSFALACVVVVLLALALAEHPSLVRRSVVLASAEGVVQVRSAARGESLWRSAPPGYRLAQGLELRVAEGAAVIDLFDGSRMRLDTGAEVALSVLRSSVLGQTHRVAITQRNGYVLYNVASGGARSLFTVSAPSSSVHARTGDDTFAVDVAADAATRVLVVQGNVTVSHDRANLFLAGRESLLISGQGSLALLPTLSGPYLARPQVTATATPSFAPEPLGAYPVASRTRAPATGTSTPAQATVAPSLAARTGTRTEAPRPSPSRTPEPYESPQPTGWLQTVTPATRAPVKPSVTPTRRHTATPVAKVPTAWPTMPKVPTAWPTMPKAPTAWPTMPAMPTPPPQAETIMPKIETIVPKIETMVSKITPPHEWPTSIPRELPTWPKPW